MINIQTFVCQKNQVEEGKPLYFPWLTENQLNDAFNITNAQEGVFKVKYNRNINVCIGFVMGENQESENISYILKTLKKDDGKLMNSYIKKQFKPIVKKVIYDILKSNEKEDLELKQYLLLYLYDLSETNLDNSIEIVCNKIKNKIHFLLFDMHQFDKDSFATYGVMFAPVLLSFINADFIQDNYSPIQHQIFKRNISGNSQKKILEHIKNIMYLAIKFYLLHILKF